MKKKDKSAIKKFPDIYPEIPDLIDMQGELMNLFNLVPELICIATVDGYFKKLNPAWETVLGFTIEELMSKPLKEFIHPDDTDRTFAEFEKQLKGSQTINFTNRYLCKNGTYKTLSWVATPSSDKTLLYAAARDITQEISREQELSVSEEKHSVFFENSMDAILLTSPDGRINEANRAACQMFNYTESEIIGLGRAGLVDTTDPRLQNLLNERTKNGRARGELTLIKKGGIKYQTEVSSAFFTDKKGNTRTIMIIRDITESKLIVNTYLARVRLLQFASNHNLEDLLEETLNEAERLTGSLIGLYHFIDEDQKIIWMKNWSTRTKKDFCRAEWKGLIYDIAEGGVWVDCIHARCPVIHNDYSSLPNKKGMPQGHAELIRELVVPVIRDGKIKAILGVGNKPTEYNEKDTELVSILADLAWDIAERKQAEEALRESEQLLHTMLNNAPITIFATDSKGIFTLSEGKQLESVHLKPGENVGLSAIDFFGTLPFVEPTGHISAGSDIVQRVLKGETVIANNELRGINFENHIVPLRDKEGKLDGMLGIAIDITKRRQVEETLQKSEEQYRQLFDHMLNGLMVLEVICDESGVPYDHRFIQGNPAFEQLTGLSLKEQIGRTSKDFAIGWPPEVVQQLYRVAMTGESIRYERFNETLGRYYETRVFSPRKGQFAHIFTDISERKLAEEALRESETKYRTLFESSLIGISTTDRNGILIQVNQAYAQMYGFDSAEQMLKDANDIKSRYAHPDERAEILKILLDKGRIGPKEIIVVKRDGTEIYVIFTAHVVKDKNGKFLYNQAEHIDISEQKKLEKELIQSRKEMLELSLHIGEEREKERAKIAMDLHDDLGQKLTALIMDLAWMKRKLPFEIPEIITKMSSMSELLNETLIDIQKIAGGLRPSILDDLGLPAAISWLSHKFSENAGLNFRVTISPEEMTLSSELSTMIFRIIQEAFTNIVRHASATVVKLTLIKKRNLLTLSIKDNGTGISPLQINSPVSFGLIGIRERIKTQGGTFTIKGEDGKGTEIIINIPLSNVI